jgi:hypothetical protein
MSQETSECVSCRKPQAKHECGLCGDAVCRSCEIFLDETTFSLRSDVPEELKHTYYCAPCHQAQVEPELERYQETLALAREVYVFYGVSKHPLPILKKAKAEIKVPQCVDRDETILRLAFMAVEAGYNCLVEAEIASEKVRDHGYQKSAWKGRAIPAELDVERLERRTRNQL